MTKLYESGESVHQIRSALLGVITYVPHSIISDCLVNPRIMLLTGQYGQFWVEISPEG